MKAANIDGHAPQGDIADRDLPQKSVNDLKLSVAADASSEPAARDRLDLESPCRFIRNDRDARARVKHKSQRRRSAVDPNGDDRPVADHFKRDNGFITADVLVERGALPEIL